MNTWHTTPADLAAYRTGTDDPVLAASLEAHLLRCSDCRDALALAGGSATVTETERRWARLTEVVDQPPTHRVVRLGLSTGPLRAAWTAAVLLVFAVPTLPVVLSGSQVPTLLLALAPIAPGIAVALAYRDNSDPAGELALATPLAGLRLVAARALVVAVAAVPLGLLAAFLLGLSMQIALAWLLPGLALSALVLLAGTTRFDPQLVVGVLGAAWALAIALPTATHRLPAQAVADRVAGPGVQLAALGIAVLALVWTLSRREQVAYRRSA